MSFNWDRPYRVDASDFAKRFWADATPFEIGAVETAKSFARKSPDAASKPLASLTREMAR